jgi:3-deoxy-D-manno-octulosonic acid kinase
MNDLSKLVDESSIQHAKLGACVVWTAHHWSPEQALTWLQAPTHDSNLTPVAQGGRGSAWRVDLPDTQAALRHYRRGGLLSRINRDLYLWRGESLSRPYRELMVMSQLANSGLLVPQPIAAMACRVAGLFYRAAIMTQWVEHHSTLAHLRSDQAWLNAGEAIALMHKRGVWHADLNVHNILIDDDDRAWLIDFDRARQDVTDRQLLQGNLSRLLRSVRKVCPELEHHYWPLLLKGYAGQ